MSHQSATKEYIATLEISHDVKLPDDYRNYLLGENGGPCIPAIFRIGGVDSESAVDVLYGLGVERELDVLGWLEELSGKIPEQWIPIGCDPGGNVLLLDLSDPSSHPVYYWDACRAFPQSTDTHNTYLVAHSFTEFLENLAK